MIIKLRKIIGILALVLAISGIAIWLGSLIFSSPQINGVVAKNNDERVDFIKKLGWEIEETPNSEDKVVVPEVFDELYEHYNSLQKENGFDLNKYKGFIINVARYDEINELYLVSDVIMTDYSSIFFSSGSLRRIANCHLNFKSV